MNNITEDTRAAMDRIRRIHNGDNVFDVYGKDANPSDISSDQGKLVDAFVAANPADDTEPITEAWLLENTTEHSEHIRLLGSLAVLYANSPKDPFIRLPDIRVSQLTRGDVRRLCESLGIPLEEN